MRTTIRLDDDLLRQAKQAAARSKQTLTALIEESLRRTLAVREPPRPSRPVKLPTYGGKGLGSAVNLSDNESVRALLVEGQPLERLR